jgi:hypothetical protein
MKWIKITQSGHEVVKWIKIAQSGHEVVKWIQVPQAGYVNILGFCEHINEPCKSVNTWNVFDQLSEYNCLTNTCFVEQLVYKQGDAHYDAERTLLKDFLNTTRKRRREVG